jgi:cyclic pyranopterin monophosphate synthase
VTAVKEQEKERLKGQEQDQEHVIDPLTHINEQGRARMVDITDKQVTSRSAVAHTTVTMEPATLTRILEGRIGKGDVLAVAQVAGIMAAKRTSELIPMCHPIPISGVNIRFSDNQDNELYIEAEVKTTGQTGVEMEALTAVSTAALTVYDMCKALQKDMVIGPTLLALKTGGKSGDYIRSNKIM